MSRLPFGEVFGFAVSDQSEVARSSREAKLCPFRGSNCTKASTVDPIGVCSLSSGNNLVTLCPVRFKQENRLFTDVGRLAFGPGARIVAAPEVRVLRVPSAGGVMKKIGKIDYLIGKLGPDDTTIDFAALEVQAVYFSGSEVRTALAEFLRSGKLSPNAYKRPDWRSSIQKRLMPQLSLKVPLFRRWGKKFFVATDGLFFAEIPAMQTVSSLVNSEVTWLVYPFAKIDPGYSMGTPMVYYTLWDDVLTALREGAAPEPSEVLAEINDKHQRLRLQILTT